jgi:acyl carrier protein
MAARNPQVIERLNRVGMKTIAPDQGLQVLEKLLLEQPVRVGVVPFNWLQFREKQWAASPFFANFTNLSEQPSKQSVKIEFRQKLEAVPLRERKDFLVAHISSHVVQILGGNPSNSLNQKRDFLSMGMDSLTSIELRNSLQTSLGSSLPPTLLFEYPTVEELVGYFTQKVFSALMIPDSDISESSSIELEQKAAKMMDATQDLDNNQEKST